MKIAYLIYGIYNSGGMERVLCNKTQWLADHGYDVTIITTDQSGREPFFQFDRRITHLDLCINYESTNGKNILLKTLSYFKKQRSYREKLTKVLIEQKFDIVISMFGAETHWLPKIKDGSKKIAEIHFSKFFRQQQERGGLWKLSDKYRSSKDEKAIKMYHKFVVLTYEDKGYWGGIQNITVIPNATTFTPQDIATLENKRVIAAGRLSHQKGYEYMVAAWKQVNKKHPDWILDIFGGGEDFEKISSLIQELGLEQSITICPATPHIEAEFLDSSIYLLSSRYEGLPMVLLEAMSCGVPAVSFACKCGPRDIITDGENGILVPPEDVQGLAEGICRLIENPELRLSMGANAAKSVRENFNQEVVMPKWAALFSELTK